MALAWPLRGADDFGQKGLGHGIAMQNAVFTAFFVIYNELNRDLGPIWPLRIRGPRPVSQHISLIACHMIPR